MNELQRILIKSANELQDTLGWHLGNEGEKETDIDEDSFFVKFMYSRLSELLSEEMKITLHKKEVLDTINKIANLTDELAAAKSYLQYLENK